ncbi:MAG TPA: metal-dependent transcriptional regulator [Anaerolineaceae bacterium]|nr:metal-dependent transcriptional regulator [Anaerolineaceae bacterium]
MNIKISKSEGDYLKAIYHLTQQEEITNTVALSEMLNVKPPSVTSMLNKLLHQEPALVEYKKWRGVKLTDSGKRLALQLLRRHRLIEQFLVEKLNYTWEEVHEEAEELEHVISEKFEEHLSVLLGDPQFDPHGDPIPDRDLNFPNSDTLSLTDLVVDQAAIVRRVNINQSDLLRYLSEQGIVPGAKIQIQNRNPYDETLQLSVGDEKSAYALGPEISKLIFVEKITDI